MRGDIKDAFPHFLKATELKPENPESHNNLGLAYSYFGMMDKAIEQYKTAVHIKDDTSMDTNLGNAYEQVKDYPDAVETYNHALALNPSNASAHCNLGYALMQMGRVPDAIGEFIKAVELDPVNMPQARMDLNEALKIEGIDYTEPTPPAGKYPFDAPTAVDLLKRFPPPTQGVKHRRAHKIEAHLHRHRRPSSIAKAIADGVPRGRQDNPETASVQQAPDAPERDGERYNRGKPIARGLRVPARFLRKPTAPYPPSSAPRMLLPVANCSHIPASPMCSHPSAAR
jgi:tetratricopeptide (TPR) repeat protein